MVPIEPRRMIGGNLVLVIERFPRMNMEEHVVGIAGRRNMHSVQMKVGYLVELIAQMYSKGIARPHLQGGSGKHALIDVADRRALSDLVPDGFCLQARLQEAAAAAANRR